MKRADIMETIRELKDMFLAGAISEEEFQRLKMEFLQEQNLVPAGGNQEAGQPSPVHPKTTSGASIPSHRANPDPFVPKARVSVSEDALQGVPIATSRTGSSMELDAVPQDSTPGPQSEQTPPFQSQAGPSHTPSQGLPANNPVEDRTQQFMNLYTQATQQAGTDPNGALRKLEEARLLAPELCDDVFRQWVTFAKYTLQQQRMAERGPNPLGSLTPIPASRTPVPQTVSPLPAAVEADPFTPDEGQSAGHAVATFPFERETAENPNPFAGQLDSHQQPQENGNLPKPLFSSPISASPFEPKPGASLPSGFADSTPSSNPFEPLNAQAQAPNPFDPQHTGALGSNPFEPKPSSQAEDNPFQAFEAELLFEDSEDTSEGASALTPGPAAASVPSFSDSTNPGFEMPKSLAPETSSSQELDDPTSILLEGVNDLLGEEDFAGAFDLLEHLRPQNPDSKKIETLYNLCRKHIEKDYEEDYKELDSMFPILTCPPEELLSVQNQFDHRAGFLFSQMNGATSIEDLISISGMDDFDVVRTIEKLKDRGMVRIEKQ